jgi:YD repeat-containing protein
MGDYRFRADKDGEQYWSGEINHCILPGCTTATVVVDEELAYTAPPTTASSAPLIGDATILLMAPLLLLSAGWRKRHGGIWIKTVGGVLLAAAIVIGIACMAPTPATAAVTSPAAPATYLLPSSAPASIPAETTPEAPAAQTTTGITTTTRVISYTYDPLGRLIEAEYSTGEYFGYAYDAVGNRI